MRGRADGADATGDVGNTIGVRDTAGDGEAAGSNAFTAGLFVGPDAPVRTAPTAPPRATSPAVTRISSSTPAAVAGTSMDTLSVSISNRLSPGLTASPIDLNQAVILPSVTVSPSCGIRMSMFGVSPAQRYVLGLEELHHAFMCALAADAALLGAAERRGRIGNEPAVEPDHAVIELFRHPHAAAQVLGVEIRDQTIFSVVGAPDHLVLRPEGLDRGDRSENLLVQHGCTVRYASEHGGRIEITLAVRRLRSG